MYNIMTYIVDFIRSASEMRKIGRSRGSVMCHFIETATICSDPDGTGMILRYRADKIMTQVAESIESDEHLVGYLEKVEKGDINPYAAAKEILSDQALIETWLHGVKEN